MYQWKWVSQIKIWGYSSSTTQWVNVLSRGLLTPNGNTDLGHQHWFRKWLRTWWHQALLLTNGHFSYVRFCSNHMTATVSIQATVLYNEFHNNYNHYRFVVPALGHPELSHTPGANKHTACYLWITRQWRFEYQSWNKIIKCLQTQINLHSLTFWEWNDKCHKKRTILHSSRNFKQYACRPKTGPLRLILYTSLNKIVENLNFD